MIVRRIHIQNNSWPRTISEDDNFSVCPITEAWEPNTSFFFLLTYLCMNNSYYGVGD